MLFVGFFFFHNLSFRIFKFRNSKSQCIPLYSYTVTLIKMKTQNVYESIKKLEICYSLNIQSMTIFVYTEAIFSLKSVEISIIIN